ncbi:MAG: alpha/beta hydrolase, partial [Pseudomonadota bacterium]
LELPDRTLAYQVIAPTAIPVTVMFLSGFRSTMFGEKANHLESWAHGKGLGFARFDYSGHGASSGAFAEGTIGAWLDDALTLIDKCTQGPIVLVGSSMGAWIAALCALRRAERVAGLMGIAAAPDFSEDLIPDRLGTEGMAALQRDGIIERPSAYSEEPDVLTWRFLQEARDHLVLRSPIDLTCPLRLIHGLDDGDVTWRQSERLAEQWAGHDVELLLVKDGDHRLSRPADLKRMSFELSRLLHHLGFEACA